MRPFLLLLAAVLQTIPSGAPAAVSGIVFVDADADGAFDPGERPLAGVVVSDQATAVATAADGRYSLPGGQGHGLVFVSTPRGYAAVGRFWRPAAGGRADFALRPADAGEQFAFVHASDPHADEQSVPRLRRVAEIARARGAAFVLVSGDLIRDALRVGEAEARALYELYAREVAAFAMPVWSAPGNHEIFGIERHLSLVSPRHPLYGKRMYREYLGPNYYSFNAGAIHFIALDTADYNDLSYYGHVDDGQRAWLERDLALVPDGAPVVTFNHIPFFSAAALADGITESGPAPSLIELDGRTFFRHTVTNAGAVLRLLRARRHVLALGGHLHARERIRFEADGVDTRFEQAAAVVEPRTAADGAVSLPSGVTLYRVKGWEVGEGEFVAIER
jgi:hypothetical protein